MKLEFLFFLVICSSSVFWLKALFTETNDSTLRKSGGESFPVVRRGGADRFRDIALDD